MWSQCKCSLWPDEVFTAILIPEVRPSRTSEASLSFLGLALTERNLSFPDTYVLGHCPLTSDRAHEATTYSVSDT